MPNWCQNTLTIKGSEEDITEFETKIKELNTRKNSTKAISLAVLLPIPLGLKYSTGKETEEELAALKQKFGHNNEYDWCINNWGTKWDPNIDSYEKEVEEEIIIQFDSAWSPPLEAYRKISTQFPELTFLLDYNEEGCCFKGIAKTKNGILEDYVINY